MAEPVEFACRYAGFDERRDVVENFGAQAARDAHLFNFLWCFYGDAHGLHLSGYGRARLAHAARAGNPAREWPGLAGLEGCNGLLLTIGGLLVCTRQNSHVRPIEVRWVFRKDGSRQGVVPHGRARQAGRRSNLCIGVQNVCHHASNARSGCSLWSPNPFLEPEDGSLHFRSAQQDPDRCLL